MNHDGTGSASGGPAGDVGASLAKPRRGRLTIFLGMCHGVGKTHAMLREARDRRREGVDVLIAAVNTRGCAEMESLIEEIKIPPGRPIVARSGDGRAMDVDGIIAARPRVVLVDELARVNGPSSRHANRYQDVLEILDHGIDVFTTLNVHEIGSRVDVVRSVTGVKTEAVVPDLLVDAADEIRLVELTPALLLKRFAEGKVRLDDAATERFFREEHLAALREMTLRVVAEHAGFALRKTMAERNIEGPWRSGERLMVAVGPSPYSGYLVRYTRRMASALNAPWIAVYVESSRPLSNADTTRLSENLSIARRLGAEVIWTAGDDLAHSLLEEARSRNVSQIIVGKPLGDVIGRWRRGAVLRRLVRDSGEIDICAVRATSDQQAHGPSPGSDRPASARRELAYALAIVLSFTALFWLIAPVTGFRSISLLYLALVVFLALKLSMLSTMIVASLSALFWNFLFIPPRYTFRIHTIEDTLMFGLLFLVAVALGGSTARLNWRARAERRLQERTRVLLRLSRSAIGSGTVKEYLAVVLDEIQRLLRASGVVYLAGADGTISETPEVSAGWRPDDREFAAAVWSFTGGRTAGRGTETYADADGYYVPLATAEARLGVLGVRRTAGESLSLDERDLLGAIADLLAAAIDRDALARRGRELQIADESQRLFKTVFSGVSHELKTPLSVIAGTVAAIMAKAPAALVEEELKELDLSVQRLRRVVENLMNMSRLESGYLRPEQVWCEIDEVIESARKQTEDLLDGRELHVAVAPGAEVAVKVDAAFLECLVSNLLANAAQYTPPETRIDIAASMDDGRLLLSVADEGPGMPPEFLPRAFEKFSRAAPSRAGGTGLGLAIVRGFAQAMGGVVTARNRAGGGAEFCLSLPVETARVDES